MIRARVTGRRHQRGEMNKVESQFAGYLTGLKLSGQIKEFWFEEWTFVLADGCRYTPDFVVQDALDYLIAYDTKGTKSSRNERGEWTDKPWMEEDSAVKIKVFPMRFPIELHIAYRANKTDGGNWHFIKV